MIPDDIRIAPIEKRLLYFENILIAHPHLVNTFNALLKVIEQRDSPLLVGIVGASGSGTTLLRLLLEQHIMQQWNESPHHNPGFLPLVSISARALGIPFDLSGYRIQLLTALQEPLINYKIEPGDQKRRRRPTNEALQHALQQSFQHRNPAAILIDSAQYLLIGGYPHDEVDFQLTSGSREPILQAELNYETAHADGQLAEDEQRDRGAAIQIIRDTAVRTGVRHILFGSYKILDLLDIDAESGNSNSYLHIPRYVLAKQQDAETFLNLLVTLQKHLPLEQEPDLVSHHEELYSVCLGSVGFLKKQLYRTLASALEQGLPTITIDLLREHAEDPMTLARLGLEIIDGEKRIACRDGALSDGGLSKQKSRKRQPFARNPKRDKIRT